MTQALEGERERSIYSFKFSRSMITKTGVYKQQIESNFNKFWYIYYQNWTFMKLKEKVHMYSQHIVTIQCSEGTTVWGGAF